jgi:hypothetical protein
VGVEWFKVQGSREGRNGCQLIADSHLGYKDGALRQLKAVSSRLKEKNTRGRTVAAESRSHIQYHLFFLDNQILQFLK